MKRSKVEWRRELLSVRASIPKATRHEASDAIAMRLRSLSKLRDARTMFGYLPVGSEVDPGRTLDRALADSVEVLVPSTTSWSSEPSWKKLSGGEELAGPADLRLGPVVMLVPGVGFTRAGCRLGRGAGFYDRAIERLRMAGPILVIGLAFDVQVVEDLPTDYWDQAVDIVVSETRAFGASKWASELLSEVRPE